VHYINRLVQSPVSIAVVVESHMMRPFSRNAAIRQPLNSWLDNQEHPAGFGEPYAIPQRQSLDHLSVDLCSKGCGIEHTLSWTGAGHASAGPAREAYIDLTDTKTAMFSHAMAVVVHLLCST